MTADSAVGSVRDRDGFAPIGAYGVIGNGRSVALVALDGTIDWWAIPRLDTTPTFGALLDPAQGGRITLAPSDPDARVAQRYLPHTNLLETTFRTAEGEVRVTDSINSGAAGALPWSELGRRVECVRGTMTLEFRVEPGNGMGRWEPWAQADPRGPVLHAGPVTLGVRASAGVAVEVDDRLARATVTVGAGERVVLGVVASYDNALYLADIETIDARIDLTIASWRQWSAQIRWEGPGRERVVRSALALKLLTMADTGAIAAAATTSLPEQVGGPKNWDYRFAWIRDAALSIDAMAACGLQEEVHAGVTWLLSAMRRSGPKLHVMYTLDGELPDGSRHARVPGYRDSQPVMIGNDASGQLQLGVYGDLFGTVANWVFAGHVLDIGTARQLADLADRCADQWQREDAGIWELHQDRPYTSSKMNCWRALDAAARLAGGGHISRAGNRWKREAVRVRAWVEENCWSETKQAYTFYAGGDELDASVLLGAQFGYDTGKRMSSTIDAILDELGAGPLVYRYSGVHREEETFLACAYWVVHALHAVGRADEAQQRMRQLDEVASPVGLLSEMAAPGTHDLLGNIPQALSHLALIDAASALRGLASPGGPAARGQ